MSTFGHYFRVTTAGESHDKTVSCLIENCPPGMSLSESDIQPQLNRRRPGQSAITTPRDEKYRTSTRAPHMPPGLGEPCFDKLEALLAHAIMSIPATKGFGIGSGFRVAFKPPRYNLPGPDYCSLRRLRRGHLGSAKGRHDHNVAPRAVPIVEAMAAPTIADALMAQHARQLGMKIAAAGRW
ncbi:chorismate synthase [Colletotrichum caudatum]|nr:chorismate synthase [Colletotrichum caudatum]